MNAAGIVDAPKKIPFVDLKAQYAAIKPEIDEAISETVANTAFIQGDRVRNFEAGFAKLCGVKHAIGCANGTAALHAALLVAGVGPGDEVVLPALTFIATAEAIVHCGAKPIFVDSEPDTLGIDPEAYERAITPKTKAVVPVHLYGQCADMDRILAVAKSGSHEVVEDAAQSFLADCGGRPAGSMGRSGAFSLYPGKNLGAYGDAGVIVTDDDADGERLRMLVDHGRNTKYTHAFVGYNYRMDALQAAICSVKLRYIEQWTKARQAHAQRYDELLADLPVEPLARRRGHVYHLYVIAVDDRDQLQNALRAGGVACGVHYPIPLHKQPAFSDDAELSMPVAERACTRILSLPMFPELTEAQQDRVVDVIRTHYER